MRTRGWLNGVDLARGLRTLLALALLTASIALFVVQCVAPRSFDQLLAENQLPLGYRRMGLALVLGLTAAAMIAAVAFVRRKGGAALPALERLVRLCAPLAVLVMLPALLSRAAWRERELAHLVLLLVVTLSFERLLRVSLRAWPRRWVVRAERELRHVPGAVRRLAPLAVVLIIAGYYAVVVSHYTLLGHARLDTRVADLGEFDNLFFNALNGHPFRAVTSISDVRDWHGLSVHAEFGLYLLLPFYALAPGPETLLVIQSVVVALTALPVYLLAARRLGAVAGVIFALAVLLLPVVQRPNFYDFHMPPLGLLILSWVFWLLDVYLENSGKARLRWAAALGVAVALALLVREDFAVGLVALGLGLVLSGRAPRPGAAIALGSLAYFVIVTALVMPRFGPGWFHELYDDLKAPGARNFGAVILTLLTNPVFVVTTWLSEAKLLYALHMAVPLAALWLRRSWLWAAAIPGFASTLLVTNRPPMFQSSFQYTYLWVPYIVAASVLALAAIARCSSPLERRSRKGAALAALLFASLGASYQHGALLGAGHILGGFEQRTLAIGAEERKQLAALERLLERIPADASLGATNDIGAHASTRLELYHFPNGTPDYLLIGRALQPYMKDHLKQVVDAGKYQLVQREGPFRLFKRLPEKS